MTNIPGLGREVNPSLSDLLVVYSARNGRTRNMTIDELKNILAPYIDASYWYHGIGEPAPSLGLNGDFYLNEAGAGGIFFKEADVWQGPFMEGVALDVVTDATTARTLSVGDANTYIRFTSASSVAVTAPTNAAENISIGSVIEIFQAGDGIVTVSPSVGVTINHEAGLALAKNQTARLKKISADAWDFYIVDVAFPIEYIPALSVTVGAGGDYLEFDEAYAALAVMRIGTLTLAISGTHNNTLGEYTFGNCDNVNITFTAATFANPDVFLSAYSTNYAFLGKNTIGGTLNGSGVFYAKGFSFLNSTTLNYGAGYIILVDCSGIGQLNLNATGAILITGSCPGEAYGTVNANKYVVFEGNQRVGAVNSPGVLCLSGVISISAVNNTAAEEVVVLVDASEGASVSIGEVDCGANGVTTVFEARGGDIYAPPSAAGTYTNLYSQPPGINTENGMIYAEFDKAQTSAATTGTVAIEAGKTSLDLTGALAATLTLDGTEIIDGETVTVYSINGVTALTLTAPGGTVRGFMPGISAGGIINIQRAGANLNVW